MKSAILVASAACLARASLLGLGADLDLNNDGAELKVSPAVGKLVDGTIDLRLTVPHGVDLVDGHKPTGPPAPGLINLWHPPHPGVIIDGCDHDGDGDWHYVHPCPECNRNAPPSHVWTTSTVSAVPAPTGGAGGSVAVPPAAATPSTTVLPVSVPPAAAPTNGVPAPAPPPAGPPKVDTTTVSVPLVTPPVGINDADMPEPLRPAVSAATSKTLSTTAAPTAAVVPPASSKPAAVPSQGFSTMTVPAGSAQPSAHPVYPVPSNQTAPVYTPPSPPSGQHPEGCAGEGCRPVYGAPPPAGGAPAPSGTGAGSVYPTIPAVAGASRQQAISMFLFAGTAATFACLL